MVQNRFIRGESMAKKEVDGVAVEAKSIVTSLKIIQTVCMDNAHICTLCPLGTSSGMCSLHSLTPDDWRINDTNKVWRALK